MRTPSPSFLRDRCVVYAPPAEAYDTEGAASLEDGDPGPELPCFVDQSSGNGQPGSRQGGPDPHGLGRFTIRFDRDPGVTGPDQLLRVTVHRGAVLAIPLDLRSLARCVPIGNEEVWNVAADLKV